MPTPLAYNLTRDEQLWIMDKAWSGKSEFLWRGEANMDYFVPYRDIQGFQSHVKWILNDKNFINNSKPNLRLHNYRIIAVVVYLLREFFDNDKKFLNPLVAYYNPLEKINIVHPGANRYNILKMFSDNKTIDLLYFNTTGHEPEFLRDFSKILPKDLTDYDFPLLANYGSVIPQPVRIDGRHFPDDVIHSIITQIHSKLYYHDYKISTNKDFLLSDWLSDQPNIHVEFYRDVDSFLDIKATLLVTAEINYRDHEISVIHG